MIWISTFYYIYHQIWETLNKFKKKQGKVGQNLKRVQSHFGKRDRGHLVSNHNKGDIKQGYGQVKIGRRSLKTEDYVQI